MISVDAVMMAAMARPLRLTLLMGTISLSFGSAVRTPQRTVERSSSEHVCQRLRGGAKVESTYAMLKPDVAGKADVVEQIEEIIEAAGLTIERRETCRLSQPLCEEFYAEHKCVPTTAPSSRMCRLPDS